MTATVFVTGAGTLLGQGILRSLRLSARPLRVVTADPGALAAGHFLADHAVRIPLARDPRYLEVVEEAIRRVRADVVFVGTDIELPLFARARESLERSTGARVVVSSPEVVEIADDKWQTAKFLETAGLPFARSALASEPDRVRALAAEVGWPLFAKPRRGARSEGARVVRDATDLEGLCAREPELVFQELLPEAPGEFTAGCLVTKGRCAGAIVLRRELRFGNTSRADWDPAYRRYEATCVQLAERLAGEGPLNFQFRVRDGAPVVFEINARFSGTTPVRALFGWNEVDVMLDHVLDGKAPPAPTARPGLVLRTTADLFVAAEEAGRLEGTTDAESPAATDHPFLRR